MYFFIHLLVEDTPSVSSEERSGFDIGAGMARDCFNDDRENSHRCQPLSTTKLQKLCFYQNMLKIKVIHLAFKIIAFSRVFETPNCSI